MLRLMPSHRVSSQPSGEQPVLQRRDVLVFVDGEPCDARPYRGGHFRVAFDEMAGDEQDVVEIDFVAVGFFGLVRLVDVHELFRFESRWRLVVQRGADAFVVFRRDERDLAPVDLVLQLAHGAVVHLDGGDAAQGPFEHLPWIARHEWHLPFAHVGPHAAELVQRGGVEGRCGDVGRDVEFGESFAHFRRGLDGEGHGERFRRIPRFGRACVGDSAGDGTCFAGAGPRDDAHRPVHGGGRLALRVVEPFENLIRCCTHRFHCGRYTDGSRGFAGKSSPLCPLYVLVLAV